MRAGLARADIPAQYLELYVAAGRRYGIDPWILAGIGSVETDHGRSPAPGVQSGVNTFGCCAGPMQFSTVGSPSTWDRYGIDGNDDGRTSVYDPADRPEDGFRAASATTPFVATVALQLVAERRLSLSDSLERWLPGTLPYGDEVTVRQLLNHTSGVPNYSRAPAIELYRGNRFRSWQPRELVALVAGQPPDFAPGTSWSYSITNNVLAGMIVERAAGRDLGRELERRIIRPLRLRDTYLPVNFPFLVWPHASGYSLDRDEQLNPVDGPLLDFTVYNPALAWGTNLVSDMDDLARFYRALMGGRLLRSAQLAEMKTTVEVAPGYRWGLGLEVVDFACGPRWGHSGDVPGFANELFSSEDGTHQFGLMINAAAAPAAVYETIVAVDEQAVREAFAGMPCAAGAPSSARSRRPPAVGRRGSWRANDGRDLPGADGGRFATQRGLSSPVWRPRLAGARVLCDEPEADSADAEGRPGLRAELSESPSPTRVARRSRMWSDPMPQLPAHASPQCAVDAVCPGTAGRADHDAPRRGDAALAGVDRRQAEDGGWSTASSRACQRPWPLVVAATR